MAADPITVSAVLMRDEAGRVLTVRKRGTARLMFPGGKPEPGESPRDTAVREAAEELAVSLDPAALRYVGTFRAEAANEPGHQVEAVVYEHPQVPVREPRAEIEHLEWVDPFADVPGLAPLLREAVFPHALHHPPF